VGGRELGVVVDPDLIVAVAARGLDEDDDVTELDARDDAPALVSRYRSPGDAPHWACIASVSLGSNVANHAS